MGDITRHPPIYIGGVFEEISHHHLANTNSKKEICSAWMSPHNGWNSNEKIVQKSRVRNSDKTLVQETHAENLGEGKLEQGRSGSTQVISSGRKLGRGHRTKKLGEVVWANQVRSSGNPGEVVRASWVRSSGNSSGVIPVNPVRLSRDPGEVVW